MHICPFVSSSVLCYKTTNNYNGKFGLANESTYKPLCFFDLFCQYTGVINNPSQKWASGKEDSRVFFFHAPTQRTSVNTKKSET